MITVLRLGKPVEHLQAALRTAQTTGEIKEQVTTIGRQLGYFGFLAYDTLVWANAVRFITLKPDTAKAVNKTSNRFWLAGISFSILNCIFKVRPCHPLPVPSPYALIDGAPHVRGAGLARRK